MTNFFPTVEYKHSSVAIATTSTEIVAKKDARRFLILQNISDTDVDIAVGATAVADAGIRIHANGGSFEMKPSSGNLSVLAVNGIHAGSGTKKMLVTEG